MNKNEIQEIALAVVNLLNTNQEANKDNKSREIYSEKENQNEATYNGFREFTDNEFGKIRTVNINNEPWFVRKDVGVALEYNNPSKAIFDHVDKEDKCFIMLDIADTRNGNVLMGRTKTAVINESGLYSLIFGSKLPKAKQFKHWVTSEVLPTLRSTGFYYVTGVSRDSYMIEDPIERADRWKEEYEEKQKLEREKEQLEQEKLFLLEEKIESAPKVAFYDAVSAASAEKENQITVGKLAALLNKKGIFTKGRNKLYETLRNYGYLCKTIGEWNKPTQKMIDREYMTYKESYDHRKKVMQFQPFITGKRQIFFANEFLLYKQYNEKKENERKNK